MVERLKIAIDKARRRRGETGAQPAAASKPASKPAHSRPAAASDGVWAALPEVACDPARLRAERVVTADKTNPAHLSFDVLRTRLLKACRDNGWTQIGVTSPTKGCGKTLVCANLALSLARQPEIRAIVVDMDLRAPRLASCFGLSERRQVDAWLAGRIPSSEYLVRIGDNLALGLNDSRVPGSAELLQSERVGLSIAAMMEEFRPDLVLYDLPPMLAVDDAIAFLPRTDGVLMVAGADQTTPDEIRESERLFAEQSAFLGVVLNKSAAGGEGGYRYEYY